MTTHLLQPALDECGQHLSTVPFCVVDLETTGSSESDAITEIGAVRVQGGEVTGELSTLVNPRAHIPAVIAVLTGITDSMVASAPVLAEVLPSFLELAKGCVIVAHNARFDVGFLKRACAELGYAWPSPPVVDTVALARTVLLRDEVRDCRLATLAAYFHTTVQPNHRALSDARATVEVLHGLLERVGNLGVSTLEDLLEFSRRVSPQRRAKRVWARDLPEAPGVYAFVCEDTTDRQYLYVGTSVNIRRRVRSYFTAAETRPRMDEMVRVATGVEATVCRTPLEAEVLELRLIAAHSPRYNRRSKFPERQHWLKLTREAFPRLSLVAKVLPDGARYFGPFRQRSVAEEALLALYEATPVRRCSDRLSARKARPACALAELGRCTAPCELGEAAEGYAAIVSQVEAILAGDVRPVLAAGARRLVRLASEQRFEEAAVVRSRIDAFQRASVRRMRVGSLAACPEIVAALPAGDSWHIHVIRYGRLAAAAVALPGEPAMTVADAARQCAETVRPAPEPQPAATIEETERIADWLELPGIRLLAIDGEWSWPLNGGHRLERLEELGVAPLAAS